MGLDRLLGAVVPQRSKSRADPLDQITLRVKRPAVQVAIRWATANSAQLPQRGRATAHTHSGQSLRGGDGIEQRLHLILVGDMIVINEDALGSG
jgi:hypothetical protein